MTWPTTAQPQIADLGDIPALTSHLGPTPRPPVGADWLVQPGPTVDPQAYCCELAAAGDFCDCTADLAEVLAAFRSPLRWGGHGNLGAVA